MALNGGKSIRTKSFPWLIVGPEEKTLAGMIVRVHAEILTLCAAIKSINPETRC